jgi:hypothetical protein
MPSVLQKSNPATALKDLTDRIKALQREIAALFEPDGEGNSSAPESRILSPETRRQIVADVTVRRRGRRVKHASKVDLFDPLEAGRKGVTQLQEAEGGWWSGGELREKFGLQPATLHKRRAEYRIVSWRDAKNQFRYPKWQFNEAGALWPGIREVLQSFHSSDDWRVMRYFLGRRGQLADRTPLDLLRAGEVEKVLAHAKLHAEENTW